MLCYNAADVGFREGDFGVCSIYSKTMYTIVKSPTFHFSDYHKRWMSSTEMLVAVGIPVFARLADPLGEPAILTSYCVEHSSNLLREERTRNRRVQVAGNTMNPAIAGFCLLYALLWSRRAEDSVFFRMSRMLNDV
jgi:hypothetical protein